MNTIYRHIGAALLVVVAIILMQVSFAGSPAIYEKQAKDTISEIYRELIDRDYCADQHDCRKKYDLFVRPTKSGFSVLLYGEDSEGIINKVNAISTSAYLHNNQEITISNYFYRQKHKDVSKMPLWLGGDRAFASLKFKANR